MGNADVTKQRILDAAESMFGTHGFDGTTLRSIVKEAGVNLALVSYHFGSKEELFQAVVARMAQPIIEGQLAALKQIEVTEESPSVEAVLHAYIRPGIDSLLSDDRLASGRAKFFARYYMEPLSVQEFVDRVFAACDARFLDMLQRALPEQSRMQLSWKAETVVSVMVLAITQMGRPNSLIRSNSKTDRERAISELVAFAAYGMQGVSQKHASDSEKRHSTLERPFPLTVPLFSEQPIDS